MPDLPDLGGMAEEKPRGRITPAKGDEKNWRHRAFCDSRLHLTKWGRRESVDLYAAAKGQSGDYCVYSFNVCGTDDDYRVELSKYDFSCTCPARVRDACKHVQFVCRYILAFQQNEALSPQAVVDRCANVFDKIPPGKLLMFCACSGHERDIDLTDGSLLKWCPECCVPICWDTYLAKIARGEAECDICGERYIELAKDKDLADRVRPAQSEPVRPARRLKRPRESDEEEEHEAPHLP